MGRPFLVAGALVAGIAGASGCGKGDGGGPPGAESTPAEAATAGAAGALGSGAPGSERLGSASQAGAAVPESESVLDRGAAPTTGSTTAAAAPPSERGEVATELFITARALQARLDESEPPTLIDVRPEERYDAFHIPNALRLEPVALGHAAPSRVGRGVVIADGHGADGIAEKVAALREKGLDLVVLHGGMQAWCRLGGKTTLPCRGADRMAPSDLARAPRDGDQLVVVALAADLPDLSKSEERATKALPDALQLTWSSAEDLAEAIARAQQQSEARQVAVVDADGTTYGALRDAMQSRIDAHVFFVDLGLRGVESYQQSREAMLSRRTIVSQGARQAGASGRRPAIVRAPKGCGCL